VEVLKVLQGLEVLKVGRAPSSTSRTWSASSTF